MIIGLAGVRLCLHFGLRDKLLVWFESGVVAGAAVSLLLWPGAWLPILATAAFAGTIGAAIGPVMGGYIFDTTGSYSLAFLISGTLAAIGIMLASGLRPIVRS